MSVNPDSIPRYAVPTQAELEDIFRDPTPGELYQSCVHRSVCLMWNQTLELNDERMGRRLGCDECKEWEDR